MSINQSSIESCDLRSQKFSILLSTPLGNKPLTVLPGIGKSAYKKLKETKGIVEAWDLLYDFIHHFQYDHEQFRLWLIKDYRLPEFRATECAIALIDYVEQAKKNQWPLP